MSVTGSWPSAWAAHTIERDVHDEHTSIFNAAVARQEARAALALEAHIRLTCDLLLQQAARRSVDDPAVDADWMRGAS